MFVSFHFPFEPALLHNSNRMNLCSSILPFHAGLQIISVDVTHENWFLSSYSLLVLSLRQSPVQKPGRESERKGHAVVDLRPLNKEVLRDVYPIPTWTMSSS